MSSTNTKAMKSGAWYIFSNFLVRGMALITTPIFARLLTHEQVGDYSNFHSWLNIATIVITMRMEASLISAKFDYHDRLQEYNRSMIALMTVVTVVWAIVLNLFRDFFTAQMNIGLLYINLILLYSFFHAIVNIFQMNERYQFRYKRSVAVALLVAFSTTLTSIFLVLTMRDRLLGRVLGSILPVAVIGFVLMLGFFRRGRSIDPYAWPYTLRISFPYVPHLLSLTVLNSVDRIMITRISGSADNALYTIAYSCGHMVSILMTAMNNAYAPWLGDKLHDGSENEIRKVSKYYMLIFATLALGMMLLAPEILLIMGGKSYLEAKYVMPPVSMGCVCQFLYTQYVNVEQFKKKTAGMAVASLFAALLNYGLNAFFIPRYGYVAAAYTTLAGYLFLLVAHMFLVKRMDLDDIYDNKFVLGLTAVMMLLTIGVNYIYASSLVRYLCVGAYVVIIGIVAWNNRKLIRKLFDLVFRKMKRREN